EIRSAVAIDGHANLRLTRLVARLDAYQARIRLSKLIPPLGPLGQPLVVRPADHRLHRLADAATAETGRLTGQDAHTGHFLLCPRANLLDHLSRRAVAFLPRLHDHERPRRVDVAGADIRAALARDPQDDARD